MDYHIDRRLRLKRQDEIQTKNLYNWAIVEIDDAGSIVGHDQIPWRWTTGFIAKSIMVHDRLSFETADALGRNLSEGQSTAHHSSIRCKMRPGNPREDDFSNREPSYQFFGTDRYITDIDLDIVPSDKPEEHGCTTWGSVSYESEVDFRRETTNDYLIFYLTVPQATYDRYIWNIAQGLVDQAYLVVGVVGGFYSEWSPSISTRSVKVLAGTEHVIEGAEGAELPRLGKVGKAELHMSTTRDLRPRAKSEREADDLDLDTPQEQETKGFRWPGRK